MKTSIMKNVFKSIISLFSKTYSPENELEDAVRADDIQKAYKHLSQGADVNSKIFVEEIRYVDSHDYIGVTVTQETCLLKIAKSEPMRRLLLHFGALTLEELTQRWDEEKRKEDEMEKEKWKREQAEKERQLAEKASADNHFLDTVLKD